MADWTPKIKLLSSQAKEDILDIFIDSNINMYISTSLIESNIDNTTKIEFILSLNNEFKSVILKEEFLMTSDIIDSILRLYEYCKVDKVITISGVDCDVDNKRYFTHSNILENENNPKYFGSFYRLEIVANIFIN